MYDIVLGKREEWEQKLIQGLHERCTLCEPVGTWFTEFGPCNTGTIMNLWTMGKPLTWVFSVVNLACDHSIMDGIHDIPSQD